METKNIQRNDGKVSFQVVVESAAFENAVNRAYQKAKKDIYVPGFRKGKAPRMVIEGMYGANVFYEDAIDLLALDAYQAGLAEAKDRVVGDPAITNYAVGEDKTLTIDFQATLYPEATLGEYKGLTAYKAPVKVSADEVKKELESVQKRNARIVTVERAAKMGDTVNIDYDGYKDGVRFEGGKAEGHDLVLGSGNFVPGFEEQLVGAKAGDEKDLDITFPDNYHADLAGKPVVFKVKVNEVKETQLPELDDEFAKDVSEFDTLKEYKADLKKTLENKKKEDSESEYKNLLMAKAVANMTAEIPEVMVNERVNMIIEDYRRNCAMQGYSLEQYFGMMGVDEKTFRGYVAPGAANEVRTEVFLEKLAETEKIEISAEEIEKEYADAAAAYNMDIAKIKETVAEELITHDLRMKKAAEVVFASGIPSEEPETEAPAEAPAAEKKPAAKKSASTAKKPAAKKTAEAKAEPKTEKKPAAKKTTAAAAEKKPAAKKTAEAKAEPKTEKKPAAKKTTAAAAEKKPAAKKTAKKTEE